MVLFFNVVIKDAFFKDCQFKLLEFCCAINFTTVRLVASFFVPQIVNCSIFLYLHHLFSFSTEAVAHYFFNVILLRSESWCLQETLSCQKNQPRPPVSQGKTPLPTTSPTVPIITLDITTKHDVHSALI